MPNVNSMIKSLEPQIKNISENVAKDVTNMLVKDKNLPSSLFKLALAEKAVKGLGYGLIGTSLVFGAMAAGSVGIRYTDSFEKYKECRTEYIKDKGLPADDILTEKQQDTLYDDWCQKTDNEPENMLSKIKFHFCKAGGYWDKYFN